MFGPGMSIIILIIVAIIAIAVLAALFKKSTREISLIRTGLGGEKVILTGGAVALPYFHEVTEVNMRTLRLEVIRNGNDSLITKDKMRIDVAASFAVAVNATNESISRAAQTLGDRTFSAEKLKEIVEGKLIDAIRAVAAQMTMDEIHEGRATFVAEVRQLVADDLAENGLHLQSVSLTALDQTAFTELDENNAFNAVGMRKLAEVIAKSKKERAEIDASSEVSVRLSSMEATRRKLEIDKEEEQARIAQNIEIESLRASQSSDVATKRAQSEQLAEAARIAKELAVREAELAREKTIRNAEIARDFELQTAEITKERDLQLLQQDRQIDLAKKSEIQSAAKSAANRAKAEAATAEASIATAHQIAEAEREKALALLAAQKTSEADAARLRTLAAAEREAAADHASARMQQAKAEADSEREKAAARRDTLLAEADGQKALHDAENSLNERVIQMKEELARMQTLPKAIAEMVKPAEKIESIKIHNVSGFAGGNSNGGGEGGNTQPGTPVNQALDSIMGMAVQLPALKTLGDELGLSMGDGLKRVTEGNAEKPKADDQKPS